MKGFHVILSCGMEKTGYSGDDSVEEIGCVRLGWKIFQVEGPATREEYYEAYVSKVRFL